MRDGNSVNKYLFSFLVFVSLVLIILPTSSFIVSARLLFSYAVNPHFAFFYKYEDKISRIPSNVKNLIEADMQARERDERNRRFEAEFSSMKSIKEENDRLRSLLGISKQINRRGIFASVVSRTPVGGYSGFLINKGSRDGLKEGFAVMGFDGEKFSLAGRISEVFPGYCKVTAITNPDFSFIAYGGKDSAEGLCRGAESSGLILDYIPSKFEILIGDRIYTSPNSITFPGGLPVGEVSDIFKKSSAMNFYQAAVKPEIDIEKIKEVYVIEFFSPVEQEAKQ